MDLLLFRRQQMLSKSVEMDITFNQLCSTTLPKNVIKDNTAGSSAAFVNTLKLDGYTAGHVIYIKLKYTLNSANSVSTSSYLYGYQSNTNTIISNAELKQSAGTYEKDLIITTTANKTPQYYYSRANTGAYLDYTIVEANFIDLTIAFGEGNEPDITTCRKIFPDYYAHNTGETWHIVI